MTYSKSFWIVCVLFLVTSANTFQKLCTEIIILIAHIPNRQRPRFFETIKSSFFSRCFPLISQTSTKSLEDTKPSWTNVGPKSLKHTITRKKLKSRHAHFQSTLKSISCCLVCISLKTSSYRFPAYLQEKNL